MLWSSLCAKFFHLGPGKNYQWLLLSVLHCPVLKPHISLLFNCTRLLESCWQNTSKNQGKMNLVSMNPGGQLRKCLAVEETSEIRFSSEDWKLLLYIVFLIHFHSIIHVAEPWNLAVGCFYALWQKTTDSIPSCDQADTSPSVLQQHFPQEETTHKPQYWQLHTYKFLLCNEILWKLFVSKQFPGYFITHYKFANCSWMIKY